MEQFIKISSHEKMLADKAADRSGKPYPTDLLGCQNLYVAYTQDEAQVFTHCTLMWETVADVFLSVGSAKRVTYAPMADDPDDQRAKDIAFTRAYKAAMNAELIQAN
jgi:hypothetical protein